MNKKLRKLEKRVDKLYWKSDQRLYISTHCLFNKKNDFYVEIHATSPDKDPYGKESIYLFAMQTLSSFYESEIRGHNIVTKVEYSKKDRYTTSCLVESAHQPFYIGRPWRVFTLKKFGCIKKEDIKKCVKYFLRKVIDCWGIFNIDVTVEYEKPRKRKVKRLNKKKGKLS